MKMSFGSQMMKKTLENYAIIKLMNDMTYAITLNETLRYDILNNERLCKKTY